MESRAVAAAARCDAGRVSPQQIAKERYRRVSFGTILLEEERRKSFLSSKGKPNIPS
jgi:hypothetical protein